MDVQTFLAGNSDVTPEFGISPMRAANEASIEQLDEELNGYDTDE